VTRHDRRLISKRYPGVKLDVCGFATTSIRELGSRTFYNHDVKENKVEDILAMPIEDRVGTEGSRIAVGQTEAGRYLRVIHVPDPQPDSAFVITGYDLGPKALKALRRRRRRKK
jgi:hypothetical protein